jgi:predicted CXXCH cytochrome family protein
VTGKTTIRLLVSLVLGAALGACAGARSDSSRPASDRRPRVASNIFRRDYAGSEACRSCHADIYARWTSSPMHMMTRDARIGRFQAPFAGEQLSFMTDLATLEQHEGRRYLRLSGARSGEKLFLVTKLIGGRYREDFAGVEVSDTTAGARTNGDEHILPVSYLIFDKSLRYKGYSVMTPERPELRSGARWRTTCIFCHNTVPALSTLFDELYGDGAPVYQGSVSVELPKARRLGFVVEDRAALNQEIERELALLGADPPDDNPLLTAIEATRRRFDERHLIELGVGCEACHGGAREHARDPRRLPSSSLEASSIRVTAPGGGTPGHAADVNRSCARCHTVLFTRYPFTWEGRARNDEPGGSHINSGEARDFLLGACSSRLTCTSCHDPHAEDSATKLASLSGSAGNALCARCHAELARPERLSAHTHHPPDSPGSSCLDCHMPKKNMGLAYRLVRYHRIGSPTDRERVEGDRPLECALCHAEKSVLWTISAMERWWGKRYDRRALKGLYGPDLGIGVLAATLARGKPHERATAIGVAGEHTLRPLVPLVVDELDNEYPLVRFFARAALERIAGRPFEVDMHAPGADLVRAGKLWMEERAEP